LNRSCSTLCLDFSYERHVIYFNLFQKVISVLKIPFLRLDLMNNYKNEQVRFYKIQTVHVKRKFYKYFFNMLFVYIELNNSN